MDVGVRELKDRLSELLDKAANGEVIRVTDRGVPKALIIAAERDEPIARGIAEGWLTRRSTLPPGPFDPLPGESGAPSTTELIAIDRGD